MALLILTGTALVCLLAVPELVRLAYRRNRAT